MCKIEATSFYMEINHKSKNIIPQMFSPEDVIQFMSDYQDKIEFEKTTKDLKPNNMNDIRIAELNADFNQKVVDLKIWFSQQIKLLKEEPTQPEGYQGLNKWYRTSIGHIIYAVSINQFNCYGIRVKSEINKETHWCNDFALQYDNINRLATESEIKEAILKGCEQKGIVDGARVKSLKTNEIKKLEFGKCILDYSKKLNIACYMGVTVFDNGKFAEVVKQDNVQCIHPYPSDTNTCLVCGEEMVKNFNCEDGNCIKQCDKCKDSFEVVKKEKPPIGLLPFKLHNEFRLNDLNKAIKRFQDAGKSIPKEWEAEHQSLTAYFKGFDSTDKELLKECRIDFIQALGLCLNDTHLSERIRLRIKQINEALN